MDQAVLSSIATLRPYWFFERDYDGQGGYTPILFTSPQSPLPPGQNDVNVPPVYVRPDLVSALDPLAVAHTAGVSPLLAKFVPCPMGSTMAFQFPWVGKSVDGTPDYLYVWVVAWRIRSSGISGKQGQPANAFHHPQTREGVADTRAGTVPGSTYPIAGARVVVPGAVESAMYTHEDPTGVATPHFFTLTGNGVAISNRTPIIPILPPMFPGEDPLTNPYLDLEQGLADPGDPQITYIRNPIFLPRWMKASGDEFAVLCYKMSYTDINDPSTYLARDWDFDPDADGIPQPTGEDYLFSVLFGLGAYASTPPALPPTPCGVLASFGKAPL